MIIGIDPSLSATACVWGQDSGCESAVCFSESRGQTVANRIMRLIELSGDVSATIPWNAELVVIEGYGYGSQKGNQQAEFGGILRMELLKSGAKSIVEVAPSSVKMHCTLSL